MLAVDADVGDDVFWGDALLKNQPVAVRGGMPGAPRIVGNHIVAVAWPVDVRVAFDAAFEAIVAGATDQRVISSTRPQYVVAASAKQRIAEGTTDDVLALIGRDRSVEVAVPVPRGAIGEHDAFQAPFDPAELVLD